MPEQTRGFHARLAAIVAVALAVRLLYALLWAKSVPVIGDAHTFHRSGEPDRRRPRVHPALRVRHDRPGHADRRAPASVPALPVAVLAARGDRGAGAPRRVVPARRRHRARDRAARARGRERAGWADRRGDRRRLPAALGGGRVADERVALRPGDRAGAARGGGGAEAAERPALGAARRGRRACGADAGRGARAARGARRAGRLAGDPPRGRRGARERARAACGGRRARPVDDPQLDRLRPPGPHLDQQRHADRGRQLRAGLPRRPPRSLAPGLHPGPDQHQRGEAGGDLAQRRPRLREGPRRAPAGRRRGARPAHLGPVPPARAVALRDSGGPAPARRAGRRRDLLRARAAGDLGRGAALAPAARAAGGDARAGGARDARQRRRLRPDSLPHGGGDLDRRPRRHRARRGSRRRREA